MIVQLNIFLAILVNSYMVNRKKVEEENIPGLIRDFADILFHETQKAVCFFWPKYPYISDELIISTLSSRLKRSKSVKHIKEVQEHYHSIALSNFAEIKGKYGIVINTQRLFQILSKYFPGCVSTDSAVNPDTAALLDPTVKSVMKRFGQNVGPPDAVTKRMKMEKDFQKMIKMDTMKRIAEIHLQSTCPKHLQVREESDIVAVTLHVIIEEARNIPKVDLFRGADLFCVIFFEGASDLYQTEIRRGISQKDWKWDTKLSQDFKWVMADNSELLNLDRNVVVMVYDKDQFSEDDLIGYVLVQLREIKNGHFDSWKRIIHPNAASSKFVIRKAKIPELKLQVTLTKEVLGTTQEQDSITIVTNSANESPQRSEGSLHQVFHSDVVFLTQHGYS